MISETGFDENERKKFCCPFSLYGGLGAIRLACDQFCNEKTNEHISTTQFYAFRMCQMDALMNADGARDENTH